jgi:hypothetical protein
MRSQRFVKVALISQEQRLLIPRPHQHLMEKVLTSRLPRKIERGQLKRTGKIPAHLSLNSHALKVRGHQVIGGHTKMELYRM